MGGVLRDVCVGVECEGRVWVELRDVCGVECEGHVCGCGV